MTEPKALINIWDDMSEEDFLDALLVDRSTLTARIRLKAGSVLFRLRKHLSRHPEEIQSFQYYQRVAETCAKRSDKVLLTEPQFGFDTLRRLAKAVENLDLLSGCNWACRTDDHVVEHVLARAVSQIHSAVLLLRHGYYDESLILTRSLGETANLLVLLGSESNLLESWKASSRSERLKEYRPSAVRKRLEKSAPGFIPVDQDRYEQLSERFAHPSPGIKPGMYNPYGRPMSAILQPTGMMLALNEVSIPSAWILIAGAKILFGNLGNPPARGLAKSGVNLLENIGGIQLETVDSVVSSLADRPATAKDRK